MIVSAFSGCKYYSETLTFNDNMTSGKIEILVSYDVAEARKNNIDRPTTDSLKTKLSQFKGIIVSSSTVDYSSEYNRDYINAEFTFDSEKAFNALEKGKDGIRAVGSMFVDFNLDDWTIEYHRTIQLDPHDEGDYAVVFPKDLYVVDTNAQDVDDDMVSWYFKVGDDPLETEMYLILAEK